MTRSRFDLFFPVFRTAGLAGLTLALLAGCETRPADVAMFGPADVSEIEMTADALFGPITLDEVEITAEARDEAANTDGYASAETPAEDPSARAAQAWLAGMEAAAEAAQEVVAKAAPARAATSESYGASGGGVGIENTAFSADPPTSFAPRRKTISTRGPSETTVAGLASMTGSDAGHTSTTVTRGVSRTQTAVQQQPEPLTAEVIKSTVGRQMGKVRACYERGLKREAGLAGKLLMSWKIKTDGTVKSVSVVRDELGSDKVSMCVIDAVSSFKFPHGTETVSIEYPMAFQAERTY